MKIFLDKRCIINLCFLFLYLSSAFATATIVGKHRRLLMVGSINSIFYFLHKAAEPFNCLEQDNLA